MKCYINRCSCGNKVRLSDYGAFALVRCRCGRSIPMQPSAEAAEKLWNEQNPEGQTLPKPSFVTVKGSDLFKWREREDVTILAMDVDGASYRLHLFWR